MNRLEKTIKITEEVVSKLAKFGQPLYLACNF